MTLLFSRYAPSWEMPGVLERHRMSIRVPPLPEKECVDGADLVNPAEPQTYRRRDGTRPIAVRTWIPEEKDFEGAGPWHIWPYSFLHDPRMNPSTPWRIREIVLRDAGNRALHRDGWPRFWPKEYNGRGLPLRREFYGQSWDFWVPKAARGTRTLETRWTPVVESNSMIRFGPFELAKAARTQRLNTRRVLSNGVLSLRAWQLPPSGASKRQFNEAYPLALWFSYTPSRQDSSFLPVRVVWEDEGGRRPETFYPWIEGWNIPKRRPRRHGEGEVTAWRSQHSPPAASAKRLSLVIYGIERRVAGPALSTRTSLPFRP